MCLEVCKLELPLEPGSVALDSELVENSFEWKIGVDAVDHRPHFSCTVQAVSGLNDMKPIH